MGKSDFDTVLTNPSMETGGNKSETVVARRSSATAGLGRTRKQRETEKFLERSWWLLVVAIEVWPWMSQIDLVE